MRPSFRLRSFILPSACWLLLAGPAGAQLPPFQHEQVLTGIFSPTSICFLPDGRALVTSLGGMVSITSPIAQQPVTTSVYLALNDVNTSAEHGLLEVVLDPDFAQNHWIYLYYSALDMRNKLVRFTDMGDHADPASATVIFQTQDPFSGCCHTGGAICFDNTGKILLTVGDDFNPLLAQDLHSPYGKVHRLNRDGSVPTDNPFYDATPGPYNATGKLKSVYSYGLRNPFRAFYDAPTDRLLIGEVGGNDHTVAWEDLHLNAPGANFGWPFCGDGGRDPSGNCTDPQYSDPIFTYPHNGTGASLTGGFVYHGTMFPPEWQGRYFYGDYARNWIRYLDFDAQGHVVGDHPFVDSAVYGDLAAAAVVKLIEGPDGSLYYISIFDDYVNYTGTIHRIFLSPDQAPVCGTATASPDHGAGPSLSVHFSATATDPEGEALTYTWVFDDGQPNATGQNVTHLYTASGIYHPQLLVSDGAHTISCSTLTVQVGLPPVVQITAPANGSLFHAGDVVTFTGVATDDGPLTQASYSWAVVFNHDQHIHPAAGATGTSSFDLIIPNTGHGFTGNTHYTITLTVTDADGLSTSTSVQIFPEKVNVTVDSDPQGLEVLVEGSPHLTPFTSDQAIGQLLTVAPASQQQCQSGGGYTFDHWSDGQPMIHQYLVPATGGALTAHFASTGACAYCGTALAFDGVDDEVTLSPFTLNGDFTIEFWLRPDPVLSEADVILGNDEDFSLDLKNGHMHLLAGTDRLTSSVAVPPNQWTHYAVVRGAGQPRLYVNGMLDAAATLSTFNTALTLKTLGTGMQTGHLDGALDELRIWNEARTMGAIQSTMDMQVPPTSPGLVAYWRFDQPQVQVVEDISPGGHNGVLGATPDVGDDDPVFFATNGPMAQACPHPVTLHLRAMLQGPYDPASGRMRDDLRALGLLPLNEPYTALGLPTVGANPSGTIPPAALQVTGPNAIVDWVRIELRDASSPATVVASCNALVQRDGDIVSTDGVSVPSILVDHPSCYLALRHRNHFGVMTAQPLDVSGSAITVDLSSPAQACYGTNARVDEGGVLALVAGNTNLDSLLKYVGFANDRDPILVAVGGSVPTRTVTAYALTDVNLDGVIKYTGVRNDRDIILQNIGGQLPNIVRTEQLP